MSYIFRSFPPINLASSLKNDLFLRVLNVCIFWWEMKYLKDFFINLLFLKHGKKLFEGLLDSFIVLKAGKMNHLKDFWIYLLCLKHGKINSMIWCQICYAMFTRAKTAHLDGRFFTPTIRIIPCIPYQPFLFQNCG